MYTFLKQQRAHYLLVCLFLVVLSCKKLSEPSNNTPLQLLQERYVSHLDSCINYLDTLKLVSAKQDRIEFYKQSRRQFKLVEPILAFVEKENYKTLNAPNILKVEEEDATDIKIIKPFGFQVIEELILDDSLNKQHITEVVLKTENRLKLIKANTALHLKDYHIIWLIRDQIARTALTGVTGFDSPVLEQSLQEAAISYTAIASILKIYRQEFKSDKLYKTVLKALKAAKQELNAGRFNTFNRYSFIKNHTHYQLQLLQDIKRDWEVVFPLELAFNNDLTSLFSNATFNMDFFSDYIEVDTLIATKQALGKQLFEDTRLSRNNNMSCATCHNKDLAFTDGLKTFPKQLRNTPTLTYAAYQQSFFYDGRTGNLEGQIVDVVNNPNEFHTNLAHIQTVARQDSTYVNQFNLIYNESATQNNVRNAIAVYVRSLGDFSSKFDRNINELEHSLTENEINGFNLFMGKAKCATCHFAPIFNGTVPPYFTDTEFELLGVPNDTIENAIDPDLGRYNLFKTQERKFFFKTPTVRNISKTAPYMHNGVYTSLKQVMVFYNNGGGAGLGLNLDHQTLPPDSLKLSNQDIDDVIAFMKTLNDNY